MIRTTTGRWGWTGGVVLPRRPSTSSLLSRRNKIAAGGAVVNQSQFLHCYRNFHQQTNSMKLPQFLLNTRRCPRRYLCTTSGLTTNRSPSSSHQFPSPRTQFPYTIRIGRETRLVVSPPRSPSLVPTFSNPVTRFLTPADLSHVEWMAKKDRMGQDMFLIGPPGSFKRRVVRLYAYLLSREVEFIQLSRDTTEADIKQRREIVNKSVEFFDQPAVRCALNGHVLVLDGIEKAERNVLPVLNNLLENREMHLEDGRHLLPAWRYDSIVAEHGLETVKEWKLERVHENFRVIALGLPVPAFKGNPLDPPLRSRFQARSIDGYGGGGLGREDIINQLKLAPPKEEGKHKRHIVAAVDDAVQRMVDLAFAINGVHLREVKETVEGGGGVAKSASTDEGEELPWFVVDNLVDGCRIFKEVMLRNDHDTTTNSIIKSLVPSVFQIMYPFRSKSVESIVSKHLGDIVVDPASSSLFYKLLGQFQSKYKRTSSPHLPELLASQERVLSLVNAHLMLPGAQRAPLLYGPQGSGKSMIASGASLGSKATTVVQVYKDMSTRELFQTRTTDTSGNTVWTMSPLTQAAVNGEVCVLDGIENLHESVLSVLGKLIQEREVALPDGCSRLVPDTVGQDQDQKEPSSASPRDYPVHPDFRVIGIANSSDLDLTPEISSVFLVFRVGMTDDEEAKVVVDPSLNTDNREELMKVLAVRRELVRRADAGDKSCASIARALSVGQIKRIGRRLNTSSSSEHLPTFTNVYNACLGMFLPMLERDMLVEIMRSSGIKCPFIPETRSESTRSTSEAGTPPPVEMLSNTKVRIGNVTADIAVQQDSSDQAIAAAKVPKGGVFFDIPGHVRVLESLTEDFVYGKDHLLVIGNQGVGKNKIVDRMLEVLNIPREYIQLHRDTTVHSLTTSQRIEGGVIKTEDSPLVNAARHGLVLVVDEADKAPAHVTAVLKTLAERGEMILPDGRRITNNKNHNSSTDTETSSAATTNDTREIPLHPDFRMIVLANRPGFPFLGNNFYSVLSHVFSVNPIDNPSLSSEMELLRSYGPDVPIEDVRRVTKIFSSLRKMSDEGELAYPYSTREAVHVVKHLQAFPGDWSGALANVFDFDRWSDDVWEAVGKVVGEIVGHGVLGRTVSGEEGSIALEIVEGSEIQKLHGGEGGDSPRTDISSLLGQPKEGKFDPSGSPHVGGNTWAGGSGGFGTAGMGGVGGPYRLTDGNPVFQVSQMTKDSVSPEVLQQARELSRQLYNEKLRELKMSKHDGKVYNDFLDPIRPQIQTLRNVLDSLQSKSEERKWVRHQTSGDLDDGKLIEGLIGDKNVYKMRQDRKPEVGDPQLKPKLLRLLVDCSGSMYRFNGMDSRLDRTLSCMLMMMEAFTGYETLFKYEIFGHSGDEHELPLSPLSSPPSDDKERFEVLRQVYLHSQFCSSGDNTLEATYHSLKHLNSRNIQEQYDEVFVVVLSDANLERYGISPKELARIIEQQGSGDKSRHGGREGGSAGVACYTIFIGSIGEQAKRLKEALPNGKAFICMDAKELPKILQRVFTEGVLRD